MTTEIAVSNQLGIALATDSAVTITSGGHVKVFDTADKLFELSGKYPVAAMINGNMDCLGTPWEILVKEFRLIEGGNPRGSIEKWARDFLAYVESHNPSAEEKEEGYIDRVIGSEISTVQGAVRRIVQRYISEVSKGTDHLLTRGTLDIRRVLQIAIQIRRDNLVERPVAPSLAGLDQNELREKYAARINTRLDEAFQGTKLTDEERASLTTIIVEAFVRATESRTATGVVVAGYGADDMFPAVFSAEVDGRIAGRLKVSREKFAPISDCPHGGMVTYFAQTDVTERLLTGVDSRFLDGAADFIERAVSDAVTKTFAASQRRKLGKKASADRAKLIREMAGAARTEFEQKAAEKIKEKFSRQFDSMIAMMPKQELIELAEALVSITAIERKATADEGTVGGPVDVALITKHEGFVWIKRKHHFPRELNPRYFWRKFTTAP